MCRILPLVLILLEGGEALLERRLRIDPVQVIERDAVGPQPAQAFVDLSPERVRAALSGSVAAFRRHDASIRDGRERSADRLFAVSSGVRVGGVDVPQPRGDGLLHEGDVLARVREPVRPETDSRDLRITELQLLLHAT